MSEQRTTYSGRLVWVIDDDEMVLRLAEDFLRAQGFNVKTFMDARRALDLFPAVPPDLIVLDVMLPGLDGFEFCIQVRALAGGLEVPILMMTAHEDDGSISRAFEAGATDFVIKPVNWTIETNRLRYMLRAADTARELRRTEQDMRQARENWERTFNAISDVVTVLDGDLKVVRANAFTSDALNKPLSEILGRHCYDLFQGRTQPCEGCPVVRAFQTGSAQSGEIPYRRPGGDWLITASPMADRNGRMFQAVHVAHDLSSHKQLEEKYRQAQKLETVGTLAGGIAHEFNNLLQVVMAWSELLLADSTSPEMTSALGSIRDAAKRGRSLSEQLLTFSRRGAHKADRRPLDLNRLAEEILKILPRILPWSVKMELDLAHAPVLVNADSAQLQQVILNLAANASQAMPDGGSLKISVKAVRLDARSIEVPPGASGGCYALLEMIDTGHGMDKKTLGRIFDPFFTTRSVGQGTGMGLSIVYGIVHEHGGHIVVDSEPGAGSRFRVYFPSLLAEPVPSASAPATTETAVVTAGTHVLVVDDEAPIRQMLLRYLSRAGFAVSVASSGEEALAHYKACTSKPDLVVLDIGMPGMGGMKCLEAIRAFDHDACVLVATGYGLDDLRDRATELGAAGLLSKPYELRDLGEKIHRLLAAREGASL